MKIHQLTPQVIVNAILDLGKNYVPAEEYGTNPFRLMIYHALSQLSKKQMESVLEHDGLYSLIVKTKNPYLFSALMDKKAFEHKLHPYAKWLIAHNPPSIDLHNCVFSFENQLAEQPTTVECIRQTDKDLLIKITRYFCNFLNPENKEKLCLQFYSDFKIEMEQEIVKSIYDYGATESYFNQYMINRLKEDNIDINKYEYMNKQLPHANQNYTSEFSIFWTHHKDIQKLLEYGFKFNPDTYEFYGKSLLQALFDDGCEKTMKILLPSLSKISLQDMTHKEKEALESNPKARDLYYEIYTEKMTKNWPIKNEPEKAKTKI